MFALAITERSVPALIDDRYGTNFWSDAAALDTLFIPFAGLIAGAAMVGIHRRVHAGIVAFGGAADADQAALSVNANAVTGAGVVTGAAVLEVDLRVDAHAAADGEVVFADQRALAVHTALRTQAHVVASTTMVGVAGGVDAGACAVGGAAHAG